MLIRHRWTTNPWSGLGRSFDRLADEFPGLVRHARELTTPLLAVNIWEVGDAYVAEAEVPGVRREDLHLEVKGQELTIKGTRTATEETTHLQRERRVGEFTRTVTLPVDINADAVEATLRDGLLTVKLPKAESAVARKIEVLPN